MNTNLLLLNIILLYNIVISLLVLSKDLNLTEIQQEIKNNSTIFEDFTINFAISQVTNDFINKKFQSYFPNKDEPILVCIVGVNSLRFGNFFGYYLEELASSIEIGAHFIGIWRRSLPTKEAPWYNELLMIHYHKNISTFTEASKRIHMAGDCPWSKARSKSLQLRFQIERILKPVLNKYLQMNYQSDYNNMNTTFLFIKDINESNIFLKKLRIPLPHSIKEIYNFTETYSEQLLLKPSKEDVEDLKLFLIPDVTIQLRCNDVVGFTCSSATKPEYGFLNFHIYLKLIPKDAKTIYIVTNGQINYFDVCRSITKALVVFLSMALPDSIILVIIGNVEDSILQFQNSKTVICSSSTFCFYPSMSNKNQVYYPLSPLVVNALPLQLTPAWNWITSYEMLCVGGFMRNSNLNHSLQKEMIINKLMNPSTNMSDVCGSSMTCIIPMH